MASDRGQEIFEKTPALTDAVLSALYRGKQRFLEKRGLWRSGKTLLDILLADEYTKASMPNIFSSANCFIKPNRGEQIDY